MKKRRISLFLAILLAFSTLPITAWAEDATPEQTAEDETGKARATEDTSTKINMNRCTVKQWFSDMPYTGKPCNPIVTVVLKKDNTVLVEGQDYELKYKQVLSNKTKKEVDAAVEVGQYSVCISGIGNYTDYIVKNFKITLAELNEDEYTLTLPAGAVYDGEVKVLSGITLDKDGVSLQEDVDYRISCDPAELKNAGTYKISAEGIGNYTGILSKDFVIAPLELDATASVKPRAYKNGDLTASLEEITFTQSLDSADYVVVVGKYADANAGKDKPIDVAVTLLNTNYCFANGAKSKTVQAFGEIEQAAAPSGVQAKVVLQAEENGAAAGEVACDAFSMPADAGALQILLPEGEQTTALQDLRVDESKQKLFFNMTGKKGDTATANVIIRSENYADTTATLHATLTQKETPCLTTKPIQAVYTGDELALTADLTQDWQATNAENTAILDGTWSWADGAPKAVGSYTKQVTWTPADSAQYVGQTVPINVTIEKAPAPTLTAPENYEWTAKNGIIYEEIPFSAIAGMPEDAGKLAWSAAKNDGNADVTVTAVEDAFTVNIEHAKTDKILLTVSIVSENYADARVTIPILINDVTIKTATAENVTVSGSGGNSSSTNRSSGAAVSKTDTETDAKKESKIENIENVAEETKTAPAIEMTPIYASKTSAEARKINISAPKTELERTEIPVENVTESTVVLLLHEDGTEEVVKTTRMTDNGVAILLSGDAQVKILENDKTFDDTKDHWAEKAVKFMTARGIMHGVSESEFGVNLPMTRGMLYTTLAEIAGEDTSGGINWYDKGTAWAVENGISDGTNPQNNITREQLAAILYRFAGSPAVQGTLDFTDADAISAYAKNAVLWAIQNGILSGMGDGTIAPQGEASRGQAAAILMRYIQKFL